ncbi:MAG: Xaa-Pro peptidase family protein [Candidatus Thorarchaeota archaeon]
MSKNLELEKSAQACEILDEFDLDAWLIWVRETSQMADPVLPIILGRDLVWQSALVYSKDGIRTAIVGNFDADGIEQAGIFDEVVPYTEGIRDQLITVLEKINPNKIAINFSKNDVAADGLTVGMHLLLQEYLEGTPYQDRLVSAEHVIGSLRGRKTSSEIERIRNAVRITETIYNDAEAFVRPGLSEIEIYEFFKQRMSDYNVGDAWDPEHNPAVDAGPNKEFGHSGPTENKTKSGHLLHFDFGVKKEGYCSDIQRMFYFGSPTEIPEQIQDAFDTVYGAIQKSSQHLKPGVKGHEVDTIARDYVKERGYEEYQHALGHQVGRAAHDGGILLGPLWDRYGDSPKGEVEVGNVFTLELYVRTEDYGQLSLEEDVVVTDDGCEFLSMPQEELICIE